MNNVQVTAKDTAGIGIDSLTCSYLQNRWSDLPQILHGVSRKCCLEYVVTNFYLYQRDFLIFENNRQSHLLINVVTKTPASAHDAPVTRHLAGPISALVTATSTEAD